jgi:hypothetical protein
MSASNYPAIDAQAVKREISCARKTTREFNNKITDGKLEKNLSFLPCKDCLSQLNKEADELSEQILRLKRLFIDNPSHIFRCSCRPKSSGEWNNLILRLTY